ncbi:MAG TPA: DUF3562 domain-containing protein [Casimicrobiaceae bacterium]|nr:DUF3562 domain-containing protein [Casimicrobiaceae bacterium]
MPTLMPAPHLSSAEQLLHDRAIDELAEEMQLDAVEIREIYERQYQRLRSTARIRDYLHVLVTRHVRSALRRSHRDR